MRIPDGLLVQYITVLGWLFFIPWVVFVGRQNKNIPNNVYPKLAVFASLQFLLQIMQIPLFGFPIALGVTSVPLTILTLGLRLGLFATTAAFILTGFLIPGYFGSLGINLLNAVMASFLILLPARIRIRNQKVTRKNGILVFSVSLFYYWTLGLLIAVEMTLSKVFRSLAVTVTFLIIATIFGIIEGILSAFLLRVTVTEEPVSVPKKVKPRKLPKILKDSYFIKIGVDPIGRYARLDPRSKLITTGIFLVSLALSFEFYQEIIIFGCAIPLYFLYRPSNRFFSRLALAIPFTLLLIGVLFLGFQGENSEQAYKLGFRYFVSFVHSSLLLESEESYFRYLEALRGLGVPQPIVNVLLIALRMANRLWDDFNNMKLAMIARGANLNFGLPTGWISVINSYMILLQNIFKKGLTYSDLVSESLEERGFTGTLYFDLQTITSEGLTLQAVAGIISFVTILSRFWI